MVLVRAVDIERKHFKVNTGFQKQNDLTESVKSLTPVFLSMSVYQEYSYFKRKVQYVELFAV